MPCPLVDREEVDDEALLRRPTPRECLASEEWRSLSEQGPEQLTRAQGSRLLRVCDFHQVYALVRRALHDQRCQLEQITNEALQAYVVGIALETAYQIQSRHRRDPLVWLPQPHHDDVREARRRYLEMRERIEAAVETLMSASGERRNGLGIAHQRLINGLIDQLSDRRRAFRREADQIGAERLRPTDADLYTYHQIKLVREEIEAIRALRSILRLDMNGARRAGAPPDELRETSRTQRHLRRSERQLEQRLRELGTRPTRPIGLEERLDEYFRRSTDPLNPEGYRRAAAQRDALVQQTFSIPERAAATEVQRWEVFEALTTNTLDGVGVFSWQTMRGALFEGYAEANRDMDLGLERQFSVGTYVGHGDFAADVNTDAGQEVRPVAPDVLTLPDSLGDGTFRYRNWTEVVRGSTHATTAVQDVFAKLAYGLGLRASRDIERLMREEEGRAQDTERRNDIPPIEDQRLQEQLAAVAAEELLVRGRDRPPQLGRQVDARRVLAALTYTRMVARSSVPLAVQEERLDLVRRLDAEVREELGLDEPVLEDEVLAGEGSVGAVQAIRRSQRDSGRVGDIMRALARIIQRPANLDLCWAFMWMLLDNGARPQRKAASVTVRHFYRSPSGRIIAVEVFTTHLMDVDPIVRRAAEGRTPPERRILRTQVIGRVGTTGNAVSSHNHVEITVYHEDRQTQIGSLDLHQFFPRPTPGRPLPITPRQP